MRFLLTFFFFLSSVASSYAVEFALENQAIQLGDELQMLLTPQTGTPSFRYAVQQSTINKDEWKIEKNLFIWKPKKVGFYSATFTVIDGSQNTDSQQVSFSVVNIIPKKEIQKYTPSVQTIVKQQINFQPETRKIEFLRKNIKVAETLFQPISLYYTKGVVPQDLNLERYQMGYKLHCEAGATFTRNEVFAYTAPIYPPQTMNLFSIEQKFLVKVPQNTLFAIYFNLPKDVTMKGCTLQFSAPEGVTGYRFFDIQKNIFSGIREFTEDVHEVSISGSAIVLFTNTEFKKPVFISNTPIKVVKENAYLQSLVSSSTLLFALKNKHERQGLSRAEMAALVIHTVSSSGAKILDAKVEGKQKGKYGYKDVSEKNIYRGEITLFQKYGYGQGIRDEQFWPEKQATMKDLYFSLARSFHIQVKWWEEEKLQKAFVEQGVLSDMKTAKETFAQALTLEKAAKVIFEVQEIFTKRGSQAFAENNSFILEALRTDVINDEIINRSQKIRGITRGDLLHVFVNQKNDQFAAFRLLQTLFVEKNKKTVLFDDVLIHSSLAPAMAYAYDQNILPSSWLQSENFNENTFVTRVEALELILKSQNKIEVANTYFKRIPQECWTTKNVCNLPQDFVDKEYAQNYSIVPYAQKNGFVTNYIDRYNQELNLFIPEGRLTLPEILEWL